MVVILVFVAILVLGCTPARAPEGVPHVAVQDATGQARDLSAEFGRAPLTVITFFSAHCPCQRAHDERLRALYDAYHARGVEFVAVDAEASASPSLDSTEAIARGYPFPLWTDRDGRSADALGAEYATYTVVVDRDGVVRFAGGIDSDRTHLSKDSTPYLRNALDDLLAGRPPREVRAKVLGCALQRK